MILLIKMIIGGFTGYFTGKLTMYLLNTDTDKYEDHILYYLFVIPVAIAFLFTIEKILF